MSRATIAVIAAVGLLLGLGIVYTTDGPAYSLGRMKAHMDWSAGRREIQFYGMPAVPWDRYTTFLKERYGVTIDVVAGCVIARPHAAYVNGYDDFIGERLRDRYGHDVMQEALDDAIAYAGEEARRREGGDPGTPDQTTISLKARTD